MSQTMPEAALNPVEVPREISGAATPEDQIAEPSLRPRRLDEYIGQPKITTNLKIFLRAARGRRETLDHTLFFGPPGLGKTTLSQIIAQEMDAPLKSVSAPSIERGGDLAAVLTNLQEGEVLFIDEIHRLKPQIEEVLYPAMEDYQLDIMIGQGTAARSIKLDLPKFTLVGATTRAGLLSTPLRDRFGVSHRLEHYEPADLGRIVERSARILRVEIEPAGTVAIASRSRGTPRVANRLLRRVRDFAEVRGTGVVTAEVADQALAMLEVDEAGLDRHDRAILGAIAEKFSGGPVGLSTLAAAVDEEQDTIEDVYEPYLLQQGLLKRTPRGRVITERGFIHLGLPVPEGVASLF